MLVNADESYNLYSKLPAAYVWARHFDLTPLVRKISEDRAKDNWATLSLNAQLALRVSTLGEWNTFNSEFRQGLSENKLLVKPFLAEEKISKSFRKRCFAPITVYEERLLAQLTEGVNLFYSGNVEIISVF